MNQVKFDFKDLQYSEKFLLDIFDAIQDGVTIIDNNFNIVRSNKKFEKMFYDQLPLEGKKCYKMMNGIDTICQDCPSLISMDKQALESRTMSLEGQNGEKRWFQSNTYPVFDQQGKVKGVIKQVRDITDVVTAENQITYLAYHDSLTGLPNRNILNDNLLVSPENGDKPQISVMFLDLDRFKMINDTFGHRFGDILLQHVAKKLSKSVRDKDIVIRYGGDEFIIVLPNTSSEKAAMVASRIIRNFSQPVIIQNKEIFISPSIGISRFPDHGRDMDTILKHADSAMYLAKRSGRNNFKFFNPILTENFSRIVQLENDLRKAIEKNQLLLYYQPQVNLLTGEIIGMEALVRWCHPQLGLIPPAEFIGLAEENGYIIPLGEWVLRTACRQHNLWRQNGYPQIRLAVNVSRLQFRDADFVKTVRNVIGETGMDPGYLEIEITESVMQDMQQSLSSITKLKGMGLGISIDDFGTGYSSLSMLNHFPIDTLKIDRSFVQDIGSNPALVKTIIDMGHNLGYRVLAEGIEHETQILFLKEHGCFIGQGYLLGKPKPAGDVSFSNLSSALSSTNSGKILPGEVHG